jgi:phosphate transport system permease protein
LFVVVGLALLGYYVGRQRAVGAAVAAPPRSFHSLPGYHGGYVALWCALPALTLLVLWQVLEPAWLRSQSSIAAGSDAGVTRRSARPCL